jgi:hypothetical protein
VDRTGTDQWTSTDVARIGFVGESVAPILIWIGIKPGTLSGEDGLAVAKECKQLLVASEIYDVEVEICESVVTRYVGLTPSSGSPSSPSIPVPSVGRKIESVFDGA